MQTIEMPKTCRESLDELEIGGSILIDSDKNYNRSVWANAITAVHRDTHKQFTIRTNRETKEVRVWRLNDIAA